MATVAITPDAAKRLGELRRTTGGLALKLDNGCCGGTTLIAVESQLLGSADRLICEVEGVPLYADEWMAEACGRDHWLIDTRAGISDGAFSLEVPRGYRFVVERHVGDPRTASR